jgi:uncharacterized protein
MRWENEERSDNAEDRRGMSASRGVLGGGIGTVIIVLVALYFDVARRRYCRACPRAGHRP